MRITLIISHDENSCHHIPYVQLMSTQMKLIYRGITYDHCSSEVLEHSPRYVQAVKPSEVVDSLSVHKLIYRGVTYYKLNHQGVTYSVNLG